MKKTAVFDKCIIIHGCPPSQENVTPKDKRWMNWLADKLQAAGFEAVAPDMPKPWQPRYSEWKQVFGQYPVTEKTILVGHSCGAAFLVCWLLETKKIVKKLILVSPAKVPETADDSRQDLYNFVLPEQGVHLAEEVVIFTSNDFPHHLKSLKLYIKALKPRVIHLENKQHFLYFQTGTNEFPELLEEVLATG